MTDKPMSATTVPGWADQLGWLQHYARAEADAAAAKHSAARDVIAAGCPLRVAAEACGVTHQTVVNWANKGANNG